MKNTKLSLSIFSLLILIFSCSSDDSSSSSDFNFDGQNISFTHGFAVDGIEAESNGYYSFDFILANAAFTLNETILPSIGFDNVDNVDALLILELLNESDTFQTGTYTFSSNEPLPQYFDYFFIRLPGEDGVFDFQDIYLTATSGSVTISGSALNYSLSFDIDLSNGQNLNFEFQANDFTYLDAF